MLTLPRIQNVFDVAKRGDAGYGDAVRIRSETVQEEEVRRGWMKEHLRVKPERCCGALTREQVSIVPCGIDVVK
jgi:hypothetical protein